MTIAVAAWLVFAATSLDSVEGKRRERETVQHVIEEIAPSRLVVDRPPIAVVNTEKRQQQRARKLRKGTKWDSDDYYYGGKSSRDSKGKGKGKGRGKGKSKGSDDDNEDHCGKGSKHGKMEKKKLPDICQDLAFGSNSPFSFDDAAYDDAAFDDAAYDDEFLSSGKGKGRWVRHRQLQYDGPLCELNVFDVAGSISDFSIFVSLILVAGLEPIFLCAGPFTILAPSNAVFVANPSYLSYLLLAENKEKLVDLVWYHILPGVSLIGDFEEGRVDTLLGGLAVDIGINPVVVFNERAPLLDGDYLACNGVIHAIGDVLVSIGCKLFTLLSTLRVTWHMSTHSTCSCSHRTSPTRGPSHTRSY
jgi:Fasciclin domain